MAKSIPRFYGRIAADLHDADGTRLDDIDAMSGGPVFRIKRTDEGARIRICP